MIHSFNTTALRTFPSDLEKEFSQIKAWNHLVPSIVGDMPQINTRMKLCHAVKCYSPLMDFNTQFVSSGAKGMKTRKCDKVIYIMTVAGICKCNTDWCHTDTCAYLPQHCRIQTNTKMVLKLLSSMAGGKKKPVSCYHSNTDHEDIKGRSWKAHIHCCIPYTQQLV